MSSIRRCRQGTSRRAWLVVSVFVGLGVGFGPSVGASGFGCNVSDTATHQSFVSLQAAVDSAASGDTLKVRGTCTGATTIAKSLSIVGAPNPNWGPPTLDGAGEGPVISDDGRALSLESLTITGGNGERGGGVDYENPSGSLRLLAMTVSGNTASGLGGGIYSSAATTFAGPDAGRNSRTVVSGNTAASGGGLYVDSGSGHTLVLHGVRITGNTATGGEGGGVAVGSGVHLRTRAFTLSENAASSGGGGFALTGVSALIEGVIANNSASSGGGILSVGSQLTFCIYCGVREGVPVEISGNAVTGDGGGILDEAGSTITTLYPVDIHGNTAQGNGAGIANEASKITLSRSSTVRTNTANGNGGGIYNDPSGTVALTGSTAVTANTAALGGGIYNLGTLTGLRERNGQPRVYGNTPDDVYPPPAKPS